MKLKFIFILITSILLFLMLGCENTELIKNVDKLAIVEISFDKRMSVIDADGKSSYPSALQDMLLRAQNSEAQNKLADEFDAQIIDLLNKSASIEVVPISDIINHPFYRSEFNEIRQSFPVAFFYSPSNFKYVDLSDVNRTKKLCKALDVDAVMALRFSFSKLKKRGFRGIINTHIRLFAEIDVINKNGETIFDRNQSYISQTSMTEVDFLGQKLDLADFGTDHKKLYNEVISQFLSELERIIIQAKK